MSVRVTVVVPLYNKAQTILRSLDSICRQTFGDFEVLVIDDGSTDGSFAAAQAHTDARIRILRQANAGPGAARNYGIAEAAGELIAFLDADDEWLPTYLERSVTLLDARPNVAAVVSGYVQGPQAQSTAEYWRGRGLQDGEVTIESSTSAEFVITLLNYMNPWATVVRRAIVRQFGGFYENNCRYAEDNYLWIKVIFNEIVYLELDPLAHWHDESSGLSRNLRGARPVEPFFSDSEGLYAACKPALQPLLHSVLAIRAGKTAAMLSFWGRWIEARGLVTRFTTARELRFKWVLIGRLAATPIGAAAGHLLRGVLEALPQVKRIGSASLFSTARNSSVNSDCSSIEMSGHG